MGALPAKFFTKFVKNLVLASDLALGSGLEGISFVYFDEIVKMDEDPA